MAELKQCPFCGGEAETDSNTINFFCFHIVRCCKCRATTNGAFTKEDAIVAWNKRVQPESAVIHHDEDRAMIGFRGLEE